MGVLKRIAVLALVMLAVLCTTREVSARDNSINAKLMERVASGDFGFKQLLLIQRNSLDPSHVYTYHQEGLRPGGGLWIADFSSGEAKMNCILESPQGLILEANLNYDGHTILFSWKQTMAEPFQLFTIDITGDNLQQLTNHNSNNFNASWLPDGGIVFLSDRKPAFAYCWKTTTPILWRSDADGANPVRLSANYLNDFTPSVLENGQIVFSRWEYVDRPAIPIQGLWTINPDGTRLQGLFGNRALSPATFMDAREIPGSQGKLLCVLTAHNGPCRGAIGLVDPSQGANAQRSIRNLTPEVDVGTVDKGDGNQVRGPYLNPFPLNDQYYLVSKAGRIELRNYEGEKLGTVVKSSLRLGFYCPQPVRIREHEKLVASNLPTPSDDGTDDWGTIIMQDVYNGLGDAVPRGTIKKLAIVQEIEKPVGIDPDLRAFGFQFPVVSCGATYAPKKIWGYANVEPDGSANFKVPAQKPIYFLPLDESGQAVQRMRTFTHLMPGEVQSCVGCHADRNSVTPNTGLQSTQRPEATLRPAQELEPPEWGVHGFSYPHIVQPIWDKHCTECHGNHEPEGQLELTADKTDFFNVSYENLVRKGTQAEQWQLGGFGEPFRSSKYTSWIPSYNGQEANILEIAPGRWGAKASLLAKVIAEGHPDGQGVRRVDLADAEKARVYAWLDLNCPYYGTSDSNYLELRGCRQQLPANFTQIMKDIGQRRCSSCHENAGESDTWFNALPESFYVRIDQPEQNRFLAAPLAKTAGGIGTCGASVFASKDDPDYRRILDSFSTLQEQLEHRPRLDMMRLEDQKVSLSRNSL